MATIDTGREEIKSRLSDISGPNFGSCFVDVAVSLDPSTAKPRVVAYLKPTSDTDDKYSSVIVIEDKITGAKTDLVFSPGFSDPLMFSKFDSAWNRLLAHEGDVAIMTKELEEICKFASAPAKIDGPSKLSGTSIDELHELIQRLTGSVSTGTVTPKWIEPTFRDLISGAETFEIDMSSVRASTQWNKMRVTVENGEILVTLQSTDRDKPKNLNEEKLKQIDGPTSITFSLGKADESSGETVAQKMEPILKAFVETENASTSLFGNESSTIQALLKDSSVQLKTIRNAKIEDVTWINLRLAKDAELLNVEFSGNSIVSFVGSGNASFKGVVVPKTVDMTLFIPDITLDECNFNAKTLAGNISRMKATKTKISGYVTAKMEDAEFIGSEYEGKGIRAWLGDMYFVTSRGPKQLLERKNDYYQLHKDEAAKFKKLINSGPPFEINQLVNRIFGAANLDTPGTGPQAFAQQYIADEATSWGPGQYVTIYDKNKRRAMLFVDDTPAPITVKGKIVQPHGQGHLLLECEDGNYQSVTTSSQNELVVRLTQFLNLMEQNQSPLGDIARINGEADGAAADDAAAQADRLKGLAEERKRKAGAQPDDTPEESQNKPPPARGFDFWKDALGLTI